MPTDKTSVGLTERRIRDAKPGPKTEIIWDRQVKGLGLRVGAGGTKAYVLNYRVDGRERRATLGRVGELSLRAARDRAVAELAGIRDGESDPLDRRRERREAPTVTDAVDRFLNEECPRRIANGRMADRTVKNYRRQCASVILPTLGRLRVADVRRNDVERMVNRLKPIQRNRLLALSSRLFTLCEHWEWRQQRTNPARGIERSIETPRDRVLTPSELAALASALDASDDNPAALAAIRFAALTGLRIGEVLSIQWTHVDFENSRLTMPETKTGRRVHDLPDPALDVLAGLSRINGNVWAFTIGRDAPCGYKLVRRVFQDCARTVGLDDVRLHDLRRTVMTSAARAGVGSHVLRDLLGHKTTAMADRYIRQTGEAVREARAFVATEMAQAMAGKRGKVLPMVRRRV